MIMKWLVTEFVKFCQCKTIINLKTLDFIHTNVWRESEKGQNDDLSQKYSQNKPPNGTNLNKNAKKYVKKAF